MGLMGPSRVDGQCWWVVWASSLCERNLKPLAGPWGVHGGLIEVSWQEDGIARLYGDCGVDCAVVMDLDRRIGGDEHEGSAFAAGDVVSAGLIWACR